VESQQVVELKKALQAGYDEPYYPMGAKDLSPETRGQMRFVLLAISEADELAFYQRADEKDNAISVALDDVKGGSQVVVTVTQAGKYWVLRRFVQPPEMYEWEWQESADDETDRMQSLPRELVNELYRAVMDKMKRTSHLLPFTAPAAAEVAAGKE